MSDVHQGEYKTKHPQGTEPDQEVVDAINEKARQDRLTCAAAERIMKTRGFSLPLIGKNMDLIEVRIGACQLGLFGHQNADNDKGCIIRKMDHVDPEVEKAIRDSLVDGVMQCDVAWKIADQLGLKRLEIGNACESLGIHMKKCQLGAF